MAKDKLMAQQIYGNSALKHAPGKYLGWAGDPAATLKAGIAVQLEGCVAHDAAHDAAPAAGTNAAISVAEDIAQSVCADRQRLKAGTPGAWRH